MHRFRVPDLPRGRVHAMTASPDSAPAILTAPELAALDQRIDERIAADHAAAVRPLEPAGSQPSLPGAPSEAADVPADVGNEMPATAEQEAALAGHVAVSAAAVDIVSGSEASADRDTEPPALHPAPAVGEPLNPTTSIS
jgi:hypothetical protein